MNEDSQQGRNKSHFTEQNDRHAAEPLLGWNGTDQLALILLVDVALFHLPFLCAMIGAVAVNDWSVAIEAVHFDSSGFQFRSSTKRVIGPLA